MNRPPSPAATERPSGPAGARAFEAVVIGASAGGIEVLNVLLPALPAGFGAVVLIVTHLPADSPSHLVQTFTGRCALPVVEPDAGEPLRPAHVYVAPPAYHMLVDDDRTVALSIDAQVRFSRPSIDVLFESAAHAYRERLLGILLSGANDDGTAGLEALRAQGGTAWVQAPDSAASPVMPRTAIEHHAADEVLSPAAMARRLADLPVFS
ncbi:chemotaxis protein CheB [Burkholderia perseverans]|uniref:chemotaxis protein CheB n=1 Tax=Burkholderia perseverans TaxID=2615214 RepID=UPI001FEDB31C|nr:chemotaxis protein CheB [Burkholderia perseverans]